MKAELIIALSRECALDGDIALYQDGLRDDDNDDDDDEFISPDRRLVTTVLATPGSTFIDFLRYLKSFFFSINLFEEFEKG